MQITAKEVVDFEAAHLLMGPFMGAAILDDGEEYWFQTYAFDPDLIVRMIALYRPPPWRIADLRGAEDPPPIPRETVSPDLHWTTRAFRYVEAEWEAGRLPLAMVTYQRLSKAPGTPPADFCVPESETEARSLLDPRNWVPNSPYFHLLGVYADEFSASCFEGFNDFSDLSKDVY